MSLYTEFNRLDPPVSSFHESDTHGSSKLRELSSFTGSEICKPWASHSTSSVREHNKLFESLHHPTMLHAVKQA
ncbi:hypothetical protein AcW1_000311 [Taiwanofungus camphoratus]|nr:hypothetical protein AcW1_000311 [Antrodia cinnamomea]